MPYFELIIMYYHVKIICYQLSIQIYDVFLGIVRLAIEESMNYIFTSIVGTRNLTLLSQVKL